MEPCDGCGETRCVCPEVVRCINCTMSRREFERLVRDLYVLPLGTSYVCCDFGLNEGNRRLPKQ